MVALADEHARGALTLARCAVPPGEEFTLQAMCAFYEAEAERKGLAGKRATAAERLARHAAKEDRLQRARKAMSVHGLPVQDTTAALKRLSAAADQEVKRLGPILQAKPSELVSLRRQVALEKRAARAYTPSRMVAKAGA